LNFLFRLFEKYSNIEFHKKPSSGDELFHADVRTDGQTDMTKLTFAFRNFAHSKMK